MPIATSYFRLCWVFLVVAFELLRVEIFLSFSCRKSTALHLLQVDRLPQVVGGPHHSTCSGTQKCQSQRKETKTKTSHVFALSNRNDDSWSHLRIVRC